MILLGLTVAGCAVAIVLAGTVLARAGDVIAANTRLGGLWVGSVFLAAATSLPELATDISAVRLGAVDLAVGDLFGSSMANMLILGAISMLPAGAELFKRAALDHALYAALAVTLTAVAALGLLSANDTVWFGMSPFSIVLLVTFALGSRTAFRHSVVAHVATAAAEMQPERATSEAPHADRGRVVRVAAARFAVASIGLLAVAPLFARSVHELAMATGIGETFLGTLLVGMSTSLPELVTSLAAVRIGAFDLAVGNLFGSNAFNMSVFALLDLASTGGPVLAGASSAHAISALIATGMMGIALAALVHRSRGRLSLLEPSGALMILGYVLGLALLLRAS